MSDRLANRLSMYREVNKKRQNVVKYLSISLSHAVWTDEQADTDGPAEKLQNKNTWHCHKFK